MTKAKLTGEKGTGRIVRIMRDTGFGFIKVDADGSESFFHASAVPPGAFPNLTEGQAVAFEHAMGHKGPRAENVMPDRS